MTDASQKWILIAVVNCSYGKEMINLAFLKGTNQSCKAVTEKTFSLWSLYCLCNITSAY